MMMSNEMSNDPESSSPFKTLSDDPILHIFSFLPGADLLQLSGMNKTFKRIITESNESMSKIRLVLDFYDDDDLNLDYAIELAQTRQFTSLKLKSVDKLTDEVKVKLVALLELLSVSVDDLAVEGGISREFLSSVIATFLPKLKKCKLDNVKFNSETAPIEEIQPQNNVDHPLESLELIKTRAGKILQFFSGCNQLKTFRCVDDKFARGNDFELINNFLARQERLEKLNYDWHGLAWSRLKCFQLKELKAHCLHDTNQLAVAEFLKKLPKLTKLDIEVVGHPSRPLMEEICRIPKLEKITIRCWCVHNDEEEDEDEDVLERLVNRTVKELRIYDASGDTGKLLNIFLGVESIYICVSRDVLDLSDVPPETIRKIKRSEENSLFNVKFSPSDIPTSVEQFESVLMEFAKGFSTRIAGIKIGHESWRNSGAVRLSNSFCEGLVNCLSNLDTLEIFNIASSGKFFSFLGENEDRLKLEDVKLYKPFGTDDDKFKPKKMRIQVE